MDILPTYEDYLRQKGVTPDATYSCAVENCSTNGPAFTFIVTPLESIHSHPFICSSCWVKERTELDRIASAIDETIRKNQEPWNSDEGAQVRALRLQLIESYRWAIDPYTSPLTEACQLKYREVIKKLHRLTVDFASPTEVVWPEEPEKEYEA